MAGMETPPTAAVVATGLVGGYSIARFSGRRELGGIFLAGCGLWSAREWNRRGGPGLALPLGLLYAGAFGASHPLAKRIGAWPSVFAVTAVASGAAAALADRR
jgi:hypothetical protein